MERTSPWPNKSFRALRRAFIQAFRCRLFPLSYDAQDRTTSYGKSIPFSFFRVASQAGPTRVALFLFFFLTTDPRPLYDEATPPMFLSQ